MKAPQHRKIEVVCGDQSSLVLFLDSEFDSGNLGEATWDDEGKKVR